MKHFPSQNENPKNCVATSSCNWETEQWLKSCKRSKLNPTGISHSLWKCRFYHEMIKARIANSWCARMYNLACHPGSWESLVPWSWSGSSLSQISYPPSAGSLAELQSPPPAGHSLATGTVYGAWSGTRGRTCVHVPITPGRAMVRWQLQLTYSTEETTYFQRLCKLHQMRRCRGFVVGEKGAHPGRNWC